MALPGSEGKSARCPANSALCGLGQHHVSPYSKVYHRTMANSPLPVEAQWDSRTGGWGHSSPGHRRCHPAQARAAWGLRSAGCEGVWLRWDSICAQTAFLCGPHVCPCDSKVPQQQGSPSKATLFPPHMVVTRKRRSICPTTATSIRGRNDSADCLMILTLLTCGPPAVLAVPGVELSSVLRFLSPTAVAQAKSALSF